MCSGLANCELKSHTHGSGANGIFLCLLKRVVYLFFVTLKGNVLENSLYCEQCV